MISLADLVSICLALKIIVAVFKWCDENQIGQPEQPDPLLTSKVRILAVTWNMMGQKPTEQDFQSLLNPAGVYHDLYVIGS